MTRTSPMEMRSPCRSGAAMIGCPLRWIGALPEARSTAPLVPASITACVERIPGPSSTRSQVPLPSRICSARKTRADFSFPPS